MSWLVALWNLLVTYWTGIFGFGVPFIAAAIARRSWSKSAKTWTAFGVSILVGALGALVSGAVFTPASLGAFIVAVFVVAQLAYPILKEKIGLTGTWLDRLMNWGSDTVLTE